MPVSVLRIEFQTLFVTQVLGNLGCFKLSLHLYYASQSNLLSLPDFTRFLGYFQPQEGKPALWDLDSDYYLHVSGIGDDLIPGYR